MNIHFGLLFRDRLSRLLTYSYIIGKVIQLPLKWYITVNDQAINTDVVEYIPTIPRKLGARYTQNVIWGVPMKKGVNKTLLPIYFLLTTFF